MVKHCPDAPYWNAIRMHDDLVNGYLVSVLALADIGSKQPILEMGRRVRAPPITGLFDFPDKLLHYSSDF